MLTALSALSSAAVGDDDDGPEVVGDPVGVSIMLGTPPWGPQTASPRVKILWADYDESTSGLYVRTRFLDLSWRPDIGQEVGATLRLGDDWLWLDAFVSPDQAQARYQRCVDGTCRFEWLPAAVTVNIPANEVVMEIPWGALPDACPGEQADRTRVTSSETYRVQGGWTSYPNVFFDRAPSDGHAVSDDGSLVKRIARYGRPYEFGPLAPCTA